MRVPVFQILKESFCHVWKHKLEWIKVGFAPFVLWTIGAAFMGLAYWWSCHSVGLYEIFIAPPMKEVIGENGFLSAFGNFLNSLIATIVYLIFFINGYRYVLLNEGGQRWWTLQLNMRLMKIILYALPLLLLRIICAFLAVMIIAGANYLFNNIILNMILGIFLGLSGLYLYFRIGLVFLLIATDKPKPLRTSWRLLKGNVLRVIGLFLLIGISVYFIILIGAGVLALAIENSSLAEGDTIIIVLDLIAGAVLLLIFWAVISKATTGVYQSLTETA